MRLRRANLDRLTESTFDVVIVGSGINGAVAAAALAGQGAHVALIDRLDFAGHTSMHSSNLAWGGIKYMETYEFGLVRKLCMSRNQLIRAYPSTVQEIRFLTTISKGFRHHPVKLWLGAWLYWLIGNCFTRRPRLLPRGRIARIEPVISTDDASGAFEYSDAYLHDNDSRFVFNLVRSAMNRGCVAANYVESLSGERRDGIWHLRARDLIDGRELAVRGRVLINAAGPYVDQHNSLTGQRTQHTHVFSKGIHLIVDRISPNPRVLAFFGNDGRLFFAIPMGNRTCIGTTDTPVERPEVEVTGEDIDFVLENINKRLQPSYRLSRSDIIATRCGVRPLAVRHGETGIRDSLQLSRKHAIDVSQADAHISIFGGKLTDCINVGEEICELVGKMGVDLTLANQRYRWYGEPPRAVRDEFLRQARMMGLDELTPRTSTEPLSERLWRRYAEHAIEMLEWIREDPREAELLIEGTEYIRCEIRQAAHREMVTRLDDFLRRRSKIALVTRHETLRHSPGLMEACTMLFGEQAEAKLDEYFAEHGSAGGLGDAWNQSDAGASVRAM